MDGLPELAGYRIAERIGEGGMATVYRAVQEGLDRPVALKFLAQNLAQDEQFGKRFLREARIVGQLSHAHIVPVYEVGEKDGHYYLSMEWLTSGDLNSAMNSGLTEIQKREIITQITHALRYAHKRGFVHRDIKPDNILFRDAETAVVTDFGIARQMNSQPGDVELTAVESVIGSPRYMSPEQTRAEELDARTDLYSLGVLTWLLLTGEHPHQGETLTEIAINRHKNPTPRLPAHLSHWQSFCDGLLAYQKEDRYADCDVVLKELEQLETGKPKQINDSPNSVEKTAIYDPDAMKTSGEKTALYTGNDLTTSQSSVNNLSRWMVPLLAAVVVMIGVGFWWNQSQTENKSDRPVASAQVETIVSKTESKSELGSGAANVPTPLVEEPQVQVTPAEKTVPAEKVVGLVNKPVEPVDSSEKKLVVSHAVIGPVTVKTPTATEYFTFRDVINQATPEAAQEFIRQYPKGALAEILRVHLLGEAGHVDVIQTRADAGEAEAQLILSELYSTGWGVEKDFSRARKYAENAAKINQAFPNYHLASLLLSQSSPGSPVNERIVHLLEGSANDGFYLAQTLLGNLLFAGRVENGQTEVGSLARFEQAAEQGDRNALFNLGQIYDAGLGSVPEDSERALSYFRRASALGHPDAPNYLP